MRFLHTADWQLGLKLSFVPGDKGARLRGERFETVRRLAELAKERACDAVVVAGDVFDDNAVGNDTLQLARDALAAFAPVPVLLLPGNHDAATPDCVLRRLAAGAHVRAVLDRERVEVGGAAFYACPLTRRHERDDPTAWLPAREATDGIRVAVAHGGVLDFSEAGECPNRIDATAVLAKGFDYLALGDWHGLLQLGARVAYSGTPEATRFKEKLPGHALVVEIERPDAEPRVEAVRVQRTNWLTRSVALADDAAIEELVRFFAELPEKSRTLVDLTLAGHVSLGARARLEKMLDDEAEALAHLRVDADALHDEPSEADLASLAIDGFVGKAAERLRADPSPAARDALRLLHRFVQEERA